VDGIALKKPLETVRGAVAETLKTVEKIFYFAFTIYLVTVVIRGYI
jgi:hypothetical protein